MEILHTIEQAGIDAAIASASKGLDKKIADKIAQGCHEGLDDSLDMLKLSDRSPKERAEALMQLGVTAFACAIYEEFEASKQTNHSTL